MSINQNIKKYWEYLERKYDPPTFVKKVKIINFNELKKAADNLTNLPSIQAAP